MLLKAHKIECENAGFEAAYSPSFYYAILEGGNFELNDILLKINKPRKLESQEQLFLRFIRGCWMMMTILNL